MANEDRTPLTDWQRMQARREGYEAAHDVVQQLCRKLAEAMWNGGSGEAALYEQLVKLSRGDWQGE